MPQNGPLAPLGPSFASDDINYLDATRVSGATSITKGAAAASWRDDNAPRFGSFVYTGNAGFLSLTGNSFFGANVAIHGNTGGGELASTTVNGSLLCGNTPAFTASSLNVTGYNAAAGGTC